MRGFLVVEVSHDALGDGEGMLIILGKVVRHTRGAAVQGRSTELLLSHNLTSGGLDQRGPTEEDGAGSIYDHSLIGHAWDIGADEMRR